MIDKIFFYLKFGFKNLWRRKRRTIILGVSLFMISLIIVLGISYCLGIYRQLIISAEHNVLGKYVIFHSASKQDMLWPEELISFDSLNITKYLHDKGIKYWLQLRTKALCYNEKNETFALVSGVSKSYKDKIKIIYGDLIDWSKDEKQVLITKELSENLKAKVGDYIIIETVNRDGVRNFDYFRIKGIYKILGLPSLLGGHIILANINDIQQLLLETENYVTEIFIENFDDLNLLCKILNNNLLVQKGSKYGSLLVAIVSVVIGTTFILLSISFLVILIFLVDTLFVIIEERKKEFAYMIAIGLSNKEISGLMLTEILSLSLCFILPAVIIGSFIAYILSYYGIPIHSLAMEYLLGGYEKLYFYINPSISIFSFFIIVLIISTTITFPIQKISNWKVVDLLKE